MIVAALLAHALLMSVAAPGVLARAWTVRHPRTGLVAWHVVVATVIGSAVAAALIGAHDAWRPVAARVFWAVASADHHLHPGTDVVGHEWDASLLILALLAARLLFVAVRRRRLNRNERAHMRAAVAALTMPARDPRNHGDVTVIDLSEPTAFAVPGRHPLIVMSQPAMARLSTEEVDAVLAHERAHLDRHHAGVATWAALLADAFPRWGLVRAYASSVPRLHEMHADDLAARATDRRTVTTALLAMAQPHVPGAVAMTGGDVAARGLRLLQPTPVTRGALVAVGAGLTVALAIPVLLIAGPGLSTVTADHHPNPGHVATGPHA